MLFRCQAGYESLLEEELEAHSLRILERGPGWLRTATATRQTNWDGICFAHSILIDPVEINGQSVNALASGILETFLQSAKTERFDAQWPCRFECAAETEGLARRTNGVAKTFLENLKKRFGRIARLAGDQTPCRIGLAHGLFVCFVDFQRAYVARDLWANGQRRMSDDPQAPSRSYLKIEEAYGVIGCEPHAGETVVDLGAAPGGWSYSAAKRGARVLAIDNGPLKGGALGHPLIEHRREDAFRFRLADGQVADWLFCDLVEEPHHVMEDLLRPWLEQAWCRHFVIILKFGRVNPSALLKEAQAPGGLFAKCAQNVRVRHLYHNREEFTVVGQVVPASAKL